MRDDLVRKKNFFSLIIKISAKTSEKHTSLILNHFKNNQNRTRKLSQPNTQHPSTSWWRKNPPKNLPIHTKQEKSTGKDRKIRKPKNT
jgi:hypothetical protein